MQWKVQSRGCEGAHFPAPAYQAAHCFRPFDRSLLLYATVPHTDEARRSSLARTHRHRHWQYQHSHCIAASRSSPLCLGVGITGSSSASPPPLLLLRPRETDGDLGLGGDPHPVCGCHPHPLTGALAQEQAHTHTDTRRWRHSAFDGVAWRSFSIWLPAFSPFDSSPLSSAPITASFLFSTYLPYTSINPVHLRSPSFPLSPESGPTTKMHSLRDFFSRRACQKAASTAPHSLTPVSIDNSDNGEAGSTVSSSAGPSLFGKPGSTGSTPTKSGGGLCAQATATSSSDRTGLAGGSTGTTSRSSFMALNMSSIGLALNNIGLPAPPPAPRFLRALSRGSSADRVVDAEHANKKNVSTPPLSCCSKEVAEDPCTWFSKLRTLCPD